MQWDTVTSVNLNDVSNVAMCMKSNTKNWMNNHDEDGDMVFL